MSSWLGFLVLFFYVSLAFSLVQSNNTVIWYAPFYSGGGYSSEAQAFAFSIHQQLQTILSSSVSLPPSSTIEFYINQHGDTPKSSYLKSLRTEERNRLLSMDFTFLEKESSLLYPRRKATSTVVAICHSEPGAWDAPIPFYQTTPCPPHYADIRIGRTMFETDRLPDGWEDRINTMHEVWVPTDFARDIFIRAGVKRKKVVVLPEPVDTDFFRPRNLSDLTLSGIKNRSLRRLLEAAMITNADSNKRFTFLFVGKWETRKQLKLLLRAFFTEFQDAIVTKVQLAVLTSQYHSTTDFKKEIEKFIQAEKSLRQYSQFVADSVIVLSNVKQEYMPYLYSAVDVLVTRCVSFWSVFFLFFLLLVVFCYQVIPSFGEGWGRPHVEAMSCGMYLCMLLLFVPTLQILSHWYPSLT